MKAEYNTLSDIELFGISNNGFQKLESILDTLNKINMENESLDAGISLMLQRSVSSLGDCIRNLNEAHQRCKKLNQK